jgi:methylase of polypeptide subunit release factors
LTGILLRTPTTRDREVFLCPEESHFYSSCLEHLVFNRCASPTTVVEFGSGDGSPVINSLSRSQFEGVVYGYEPNIAAYNLAQAQISQAKLNQHYIIRNQSFFEAHRPDAGYSQASYPHVSYLIANPPYLPAPDNNIAIPLLHGGKDGAVITKQLLSLDYPNVMILVSSYSNPVGVINHAADHGYQVSDFMITPLKFGQYSSEPKVKNQIVELRSQDKAFFLKDVYFLAGVLMKRSDLCHSDLSAELIQALTSL